MIDVGLGYLVEIEDRENRPGTWNSLEVTVYRAGEIIGSYKRNYPTLFNTFVPFEKDGKHYALYSPSYTVTRLLSLQPWEDLGGENPDSYGFCPTGYYVPKESQGYFGFICGCVWGDDTSWKIQFLDLAEAEKGIVKRDDRFGYIELLGGADTLANSIQIDLDPPYKDDPGGHHRVEIACRKDFDLKFQFPEGIKLLDEED